MFDTLQFYPTPDTLIEKMVKDVDWSKSKDILEPSAGKGNILDFIYNKFKYDSWGKPHLYAIEINPELQATLLGKDYKVLDSYFLQYKPDLNFDLIVMNPPFANGEDHFLKAWDILENGELICLLNAETTLNPFSAKRQLIHKIIEDNNGTIEIMEKEFEQAERKTKVSVALVKVKKVTNKTRFDFEGMEFKETKFELDEERGIAVPDKLQNLVDSYDTALEHLEQGLKHLNYVDNFFKVVVGDDKYSNIFKALDSYSTDNIYERFNAAKQSIQAAQWNNIIKQLDLEKYMSSNVSDQFRAKVRKQSNLAINKRNIELLVSTLFYNRGNIFQSAMLDVFEELTKYHKENRVHFEGWKSNECYMISRKVVLPYVIDALNYRHGATRDRFSMYNRSFNVSDLDKVLCHLDGRSFDQILTIQQALTNRFEQIGWVYKGEKFDNEVNSTFFTIKFWRKGTCHIYFKDKELWNKFNYEVMKGKNWLPPGTKVDDGQVVPDKEILQLADQKLLPIL